MKTINEFNALNVPGMPTLHQKIKFLKGQEKELPGAYWIRHNKIAGYVYQVIVGIENGWEHVSVSLISFQKSKSGEMVKRTPTWAEMCYIKNLFWHKDEVVVQYHPAEDEYVNLADYVLHLWKPSVDVDFLNYAKKQRDEFVKHFANKDTEDRVAAENLLIAYDQMGSRLSEAMPNAPKLF